MYSTHNKIYKIYLHTSEHCTLSHLNLCPLIRKVKKKGIQESEQTTVLKSLHKIKCVFSYQFVHQECQVDTGFIDFRMNKILYVIGTMGKQIDVPTLEIFIFYHSSIKKLYISYFCNSVTVLSF